MESETPSVATPAAKRGILFRVSSVIETTMRTIFYRLGFFVALHPIKVIIASVVFTLVCLVGLLRFRTESRDTELWIPQGTLALKNRAYVEDNYGRFLRTSGIAYVARENGNLATQKSMLEMLAVAEDGWKVTAPAIDGEGADNTIITFPERCRKTTDTAGNSVCFYVSAFGLFYDDANVVMDGETVDFYATVRKGLEALNDDQIKQRLQDTSATNFDGSTFSREEILGGVSGSGNGLIVKAMLYTQFIENRAIVENGDLIDKEADALEEQWTKDLLETSDLLEGRTLDWKVQSGWSQSDSLAEALTGDLPLLGIGFGLLFVYVTLFLGDFHSVRSHMLLAAGALVTTGLALGGCFGLSSATGMFFGPVHQILPLFIIGIGIDDCFHVTRAADDVFRDPMNADKSVPAKIALALSVSGSAITVTSFTNVTVFLLSAISRLPALRFFAIWAAIGIFLAWGFAITFFTACLTLDMRRQVGQRRDCCPCFKVEEVKELNWFKKPAGGFSRFFGNQFGPFIMRPVVRIVLLILFIGWLAACCYGTSQLYLKFRFSFFFPDGSAQREYQNVIDEYYELGDPTSVYVRDRDLSITANQERLLNLCKQNGPLATNEWLQGDTLNCWYTAMRRDTGIADGAFIPEAEFYDDVKRYTAEDAPGGRFNKRILFDDDKRQVIGCQIPVSYVYRKTNDDEINALNSVREAADSVGFGDDADGNPAAFTYNFFDTFTEQYAALPGEIGISLGLAAVAVALVCFFLSGHPVVAIISVLVVGIITIDVLGLTFFSGINLNSVSVITLVLNAGIAVDFVVHIARSFMDQVGTKSERAIKALETMGPPVFYAGFSTFLAILVLSGASSYIFQVIFKGFIFLIAMGFIHGLIFSPILLSLLGPAGFYTTEEEKLKAQEELEAKVVPRKEVEVDNDAASSAEVSPDDSV